MSTQSQPEFPRVFDSTPDDDIYRSEVRPEELEPALAADPFADKPELRFADILNRPGALSAVRLPLGMLTAQAIRNEQFGRATAYAVAAGLSDALDGWDARRRGLASGAGALGDIAFDRTYEMIVIPAMREKGLVPKKLGAFVIASEAATVVGGAAILARTGDVREIMPKKRGKLGALLVFAGGAVATAGGAAPDRYQKPLKAMATGLMGAGFGYGIKGRWEIMQEKKTAQAPVETGNALENISVSYQRKR